MLNKRYYIFISLLILLFGVQSYASADNNCETARIPDITIIRGTDKSPQYNNAVNELARYLCIMSGTKVAVNDFSLEPDSNSIIVGNPEENPFTKKLVDEGILKLDIPSGNGDGFVIRSSKVDGKKYIILAGETGTSTLYAVYDYLERFCKLGFFMDGDYVPKTESIPFYGVDFASKPRFEWRHFGNSQESAAVS